MKDTQVRIYQSYDAEELQEKIKEITDETDTDNPMEEEAWRPVQVSITVDKYGKLTAAVVYKWDFRKN